MPTEPSGGTGRHSLAEIREELRRRGYLDSPLDRFLLHDRLRRRRSRFGAVVAVSIRAGMVGGPLLGWTLAATAYSMGGGMGGPLSLALLALVLTLVFAALLATLELVASLLLLRAGTRGAASALATRAAVMVGAAAVLYLGLWWRARRLDAAALGWPDLLSLAWICTVSLGLAHLTSAAGSAVVGGEAAARGAAPPRRRRSTWRIMLLLAILGGCLVLLRPGVLGIHSQPSPDFEAVAAPGRLVVVGIDGLGAAELAAVQRHGAMPRLGGLLVDAAMRELALPAGEEPPSVWTTLATGVPPAKHGVRGVEWHSLAGIPAPRVAGSLFRLLSQVTETLLPAAPTWGRRPVSAFIRRRPTAWEIMGRAGRRVLVAHWWATSPVPDLPGFLLSDRAYGRLQGGTGIAGEIHPPALAAALSRRLPALMAEVRGRLPSSPPTGSLAERALLADLFYGEVFVARLADGDVDAAFLYLSSLDIIEVEAEQEAILEQAAAVRLALGALDDLIGRVQEQLGEGDRLMVLLAPGRRGGGDRGLMILAGPGIAQGGRGGAPLLGTHVAPTLLWLAGLPVARSFDHDPVISLLQPQARSALPVRTIDDFGDPPVLSPPDPAAEAAAREELRSLGYIK